MMQLLEMMQKITAEPNNNARRNRSSGEKTLAVPTQAEPPVPSEAVDPALQSSSMALEGGVADGDDETIAGTESDSKPSPVRKAGIVVRWFRKVARWVKRLVGF